MDVLVAFLVVALTVITLIFIRSRKGPPTQSIADASSQRLRRIAAQSRKMDKLLGDNNQNVNCTWT